jgi:hypothetical protein
MLEKCYAPQALEDEGDVEEWRLEGLLSWAASKS